MDDMRTRLWMQFSCSGIINGGDQSFFLTSLWDDGFRAQAAEQTHKISLIQYVVFRKAFRHHKSMNWKACQPTKLIHWFICTCCNDIMSHIILCFERKQEQCFSNQVKIYTFTPWCLKMLSTSRFWLWNP